jgi:hypothetical protein
MHLDRTNTASVRDNDLLDIVVGKAVLHPRDLVGHIQFLRNETEGAVDEEALGDFVRAVDRADDARLDMNGKVANAQRTLNTLARLASGQALDLVLELRKHLFEIENGLGECSVDIPATLREYL